MRALTVTGRDCSQRLDKFLGKYMELAPKSFLYRMLRKKNITLNGKKADGSERLREGDVVRLWLAEETIEKFRERPDAPRPDRAADRLSIVYEDEQVIFLNKPAGLLSQKASAADVSLTELLADYLAREDDGRGTFRPGLCNRLDRNTSGLVLAGKTVAASRELSGLIAGRALRKYYLTLARGRVDEVLELEDELVKDERRNRVRIAEAIPGGARIRTVCSPLGTNGDMTLLLVELVTGKSHQIRSHLAYAGHPVAGDPKYGDPDWNRRFRERYGLAEQWLHSWRCVFPELSGALSGLSGRTFEAPLPEKKAEILKKEELYGNWL